MLKDFEAYFMPYPYMISKTQPYQHQADAVARYLTQDYGALFCEMGTGKTKIMLDILQNSPEESGVLVAAPNGLHLNWYYKEIPTHISEEAIPHYAAYCWKGRPTSKKAKKAWEAFLTCDAPYKFFLINVEALRTAAGYDHAYAFLRSLDHSSFVIDESTCIKNPKAAQTKACMKLSALATRRWILNGTPITQGPMDLFSQCKFLHKDSIPYKTYTAFKGTFAIEQVMTMGPRSFRKIVGYQQLERLTREISHFSLKLDKKDCLDLPEKVWTEHIVEPTPEQTKAYAEMKNLCLTQMESGEISSTTTALTKILRLHQILTGFITDDEGNIHHLPNNRISALKQLAESGQPLVIFCAYRANIDQIKDTLGAETCAEYHGGSTKEQRTQAVSDFQEGRKQFFLATSAGAKGITLTRASTTVYYSCNYSLETRLQSQDRIHRIGQRSSCTYVDLVTPGTIDSMILEKLNAKKDLSDSVLDDLKNMIVEA